MKRSPIKARRATPRRRAAAADGHDRPWSEVRAILFDRSRGFCEVCDADLNRTGMDAHHRERRRTGPDCPCNALALCPDCHRLVHAQPLASRQNGHIVTDTPWDTPARLRRLGLVRLGCDGGVVRLAEPEVAG